MRRQTASSGQTPERDQRSADRNRQTSVDKAESGRQGWKQADRINQREEVKCRLERDSTCCEQQSDGGLKCTDCL